MTSILKSSNKSQSVPFETEVVKYLKNRYSSPKGKLAGFFSLFRLLHSKIKKSKDHFYWNSKVFYTCLDFCDRLDLWKVFLKFLKFIDACKFQKDPSNVGKILQPSAVVKSKFVKLNYLEVHMKNIPHLEINET